MTLYKVVDGEKIEMTADEEAAFLAEGADMFPPSSVDQVSSRQFKLQLLAQGILTQVNAWVASQDQAVQIAFEYSGTFLKSEPMMQQGFTAMGFTPEQIDAFFTAASKL